MFCNLFYVVYCVYHITFSFRARDGLDAQLCDYVTQKSENGTNLVP